VKVAAVP
jgi:hypothetical protein